MLKRKVTARFEEWLASPKNKALLVSGVRQAGKTFAVREFAHRHFDNVIEVNFLDQRQAASFLAPSESAAEFIERLSLLSSKPFSQGRTLVFLDEIQEAEDVLTPSKFLVEDGRFKLVMSGSLLGVELKDTRSFPVGYLHEERMFPLDFEEFCWAQGVPDSVIGQVKECYKSRTPLEEGLHGKLVKLFRRYIVVGGMPEAVQEYLDSGRDLSAVRAVHADIENLYRKDIAKYAAERSLQIRAIYDALPSELAKQNKRFMFQSVKHGSVYESLKDDFAWLSAAGVAHESLLVTEPTPPLARTVNKRKFKLFAADTGMLVSRYPAQTAMGVLEGSRSVNFGAVYENVVAQELCCAGFDLAYYNNNRKGELDFVVETNGGYALPFEVKSGKDYKRHAALCNVLRTRDYDIDCAYVFSETNVSSGEVEGKPVYYLPLYMAMCMAEERPDNLGSLVMEELTFS